MEETERMNARMITEFFAFKDWYINWKNQIEQENLTPTKINEAFTSEVWENFTMNRMLQDNK